MKKCALLCCAMALLVAGSAQAELYGLANGRTAKLATLPPISVELGATLADADYLGLRVNYKLNQDVLLYGDFGQASVSSANADSFGLGIFYELRNVEVLPNTNFAIKTSYHSISGDHSDANLMTIETVLSGDKMGNTSLAWYGNLGFHRASGNGTSDSEIGFGAGVVHSLSVGQVYGAVDVIDDVLFSVGFRYFIQ